MGSNTGEASPDSAISRIVGVTGVILFCIVLVLVSFAVGSAKNKYSKVLFTCSIIVALLELPRYIALIIQEAYKNKLCYIMHMWGSVFFFLVFSFACFLLHDAIDMSRTTSPLAASIIKPSTFSEMLIFDRRYLVSFNGLFALVVLVTSIDCAMSRSLFDFFRNSGMYVVLTIVEVLKNIAFGVMIVVYGGRLRSRISRFATSGTCSGSSSSSSSSTALNRHTANTDTAAAAAVQARSDEDLNRKLRYVIQKLLTVMTVCNACFALRTVLLLVKVLFVEFDALPDSDLAWMPVYGMVASSVCRHVAVLYADSSNFFNRNR